MKTVHHSITMITVLWFLAACSQSNTTSDFPVAIVSVDPATHDVYHPNPLEN